MKDNRQRLSKLLRLARSFPEKLPRVIGMHLDGYQKMYRLQSSHGELRVRSYAWAFELPQYEYRDSGLEGKDEFVCDLACAAAMLHDFPRLAKMH